MAMHLYPPMEGSPFYDQGVGELDHLLIQHESGTSNYQGITKAHWKRRNSTTKCKNCGKKFSLRDRAHHCHRCGELYCKNCLQYQRKLNDLARPDPNGKPQRVCEKCYEEGPQALGQTSSHFSEFATWRHDAKINVQTKNGGITLRKERKEKLNILKECKRLTDGFQQDVASQGSISKMVFDVKRALAPPDWQRSPNRVYEKLCLKCVECHENFNITRVRRHCAICGVAICRSCTAKNLLIFIPDGTNDDEVLWAIIEVVGCPAKEPVTSIYLRICKSCNSSLQDIQVEQYKESVGDLDNWPKVIQINERLAEVQAKIDQLLPKYQELVDVLEISPGSAPSSPTHHKSNTQTLAKAQGDLNDHFTQFIFILMDLKKYQPSTRTKAVIYRNIIVSKRDYYHEKSYLYREYKKRLEEVTPTEVLESIQKFVDLNSLNSSYVCIKQLALEIIHLDLKYETTSASLDKLVELEAVVLEDLKKAIDQSGESWQEHEAALTNFIKLQIKERRLIKPSHRQITQNGGQYLQSLINRRCEEVLQKVGLQFSNRSADSRYRTSKQMINDLLDGIKDDDLLEHNQPNSP